MLTEAFLFWGATQSPPFFPGNKKKSTTWINKHVRPLNIQLGILMYWPLHIRSSIAASVDINKKQSKSFTAPTPQNTPINPAPITSEYRPSISSISEENNQGMLLWRWKGMAISWGCMFACVGESGSEENVCVCVCVRILDQDMGVKTRTKDVKF